MAWVRVALGVIGLVALGLIVWNVGPELIWSTLRPAIRWLPVLCAIELVRMACEAEASYLAFGPLAKRIPKLAIFRANVVGQAVANLAPAPRVVNETIKATLLAPYVGGGAAASVGFTIQGVTLVAVGLFSVPCAIAIFFLDGLSVWFWATTIHAVVLVASGLVFRAVTRAERPGRWLVKKFPRLAMPATAFRDHASGVGLWATGPTIALTVNRCLQCLQYWVAARAVGIDAGLARALAAQGVNLVASAVGVIVPGGFGTTDGAFTLAADMLSTTTARATALALLMRCMQIAWLLVGSVILLVKPGGMRLREQKSVS
jgi:hypothetical protein